jgi:xanthine dehydrogenase accessory factor
MRDILRTLTESVEVGRELVLCALVETRGSTPQKAGAWMLVFPDGSQCGTLGGGCVEAEVKQRALQALQTGQPEILTFQLDDNYGWDDGLICGGRMRVLAEPLGMSQRREYFAAFRALVEQGDGCTEAVVLDAERLPGTPPTARVLFGPSGEVVARRRIETLPDPLVAQLPNLAERPRPVTRGGVAYLPVLPRCRLLIVGGGHVGHAVADLAAQADFDIWVLDDRERYANRDRFPAAERILVGDVGRTLSDLPIDHRTYCLIVTRGHSHDEEALYHLAERPARYVGMIGSKRKIRLIFDDLLAAGISAQALDRVHAPVGFHIGSQTVPEIAISIVAELIAHRNLGQSPGHLRGEMTLHDCGKTNDANQHPGCCY